MVSQTLRFNSVVRTLEHHLDELGPIHTISINQRLEPSEREWSDNFAAAGGGVILHTGVHIFDLVRFFSGDEVRRVYCETDRIMYEELEDSFVATLRLRKSKIRCVVDAARYTEGRSGRIELVGERGQLVGDHVHGYGLLIRGRQPVPLDVPAAVNTVEESLKAFVQTLLHDEEPPISAVDGLLTLEIAEACYHSASSGASVELESHDEDEEEFDDDLL
jgi:predicted dehydrogenase